MKSMFDKVRIRIKSKIKLDSFDIIFLLLIVDFLFNKYIYVWADEFTSFLRFRLLRELTL